MEFSLFYVKYFVVQYTHNIRAVEHYLRHFNITHVWSKQEMHSITSFDLFFFFAPYFHQNCLHCHLGKAWIVITSIVYWFRLWRYGITDFTHGFQYRIPTLKCRFRSGANVICLKRPWSRFYNIFSPLPACRGTLSFLFINVIDIWATYIIRYCCTCYDKAAYNQSIITMIG